VPRSCLVADCGLAPHGRKRRCSWHDLAAQPVDVQVEAARARLGLVPDAVRVARVPRRLWPPRWRWCASCQSFVPDHYARGSRCRACASDAAHAAMTEKVYGLDREGYDRLLELQDGRCAICRQRPGKKRLAVDHSHATGEVRGLLCATDNHDLLGAGYDSIPKLQAAAHYLMHPPATGQWWPPEDGLEVEVTRTLQGSDKVPKSLKDYGLMTAGQEKAPPGPEDGGEQADRNPWGKRTIVLPAGAVSDPDRKGYWKLYVEVGADGKVGPAPF
jgi:hypothetical protein